MPAGNWRTGGRGRLGGNCELAREESMKRLYELLCDLYFRARYGVRPQMHNGRGSGLTHGGRIWAGRYAAAPAG